GPGFLDTLAAARGGERIPVATTGPRGRPVTAAVLLAGGTAYVESAQACGRHLVRYRELDPRHGTSAGLGSLLRAAAATGAARLVVGVGGTATHDVGAGMLAALGAGPRDAAGRDLPPGGLALAHAVALAGVPDLRVPLVAALDVDNPLTGPLGAAHGYGRQKRMRRADVPAFDAAADRFAALLARALPGCPADLAARPGAGAGGGIGAALLALGAAAVPGAAVVREATGLAAAVAAADLVVTGEGSFDAQTARGKVVADVAATARRHGRPCLVFAGRASLPDARAAALGVTAVHDLVGRLGSVARARAGAAAGLAALARDVAAAWR
ncbi:MAG TPA: glycerate kinase, partial [Pilimelia sp.]|nr:glycerate kinase [Pilimelia sp.]